MDQQQLPVQQASIYLRRTTKADVSSLIIWFMATATVVWAGWRGSREEREKAAQSRNVTATRGFLQDRPEDREQVPKVELGLRHAFFFLIVASATLLILFYLPVVMVVIVMFGLGSISSISSLIFTPLCRAL